MQTVEDRKQSLHDLNELLLYNDQCCNDDSCMHAFVKTYIMHYATWGHGNTTIDHQQWQHQMIYVRDEAEQKLSAPWHIYVKSSPNWLTS